MKPPEGDPIRLLDKLTVEHVTQRSICSLLAWVADDLSNPNVSEDAAAILCYLRKELPRHISVERTQLVPLLRGSAFPGDDLDSIVEILGAGHRDSCALAQDLHQGLTALASGELPKDPASFVITANAFCMLQKALADWEDENVLLCARLSLRAVRFEGSWKADAISPKTGSIH